MPLRRLPPAVVGRCASYFAHPRFVWAVVRAPRAPRPPRDMSELVDVRELS
eukprot:gene37199-20149_t